MREGGRERERGEREEEREREGEREKSELSATVKPMLQQKEVSWSGNVMISGAR